MKRLSIIFFLFFGLVKFSLACCADDDRTLTEMLFQGTPGTIFTCKVLTFTTPKYPEGIQVDASDGSIDGTATAEILEVYFGKVDTNIIRLRAGSYLTVGKTYLIYTSGSGRVFGFGGNCDRWTKQIDEIPDSTFDIQILKQFSNIFKNKRSGKFTFTNSKSVVIAEGEMNKGVAVKIWKHYYNNGIIKSEYDFTKNITSEYSENGFVKYKRTKTKEKSEYLTYSDKVNGQIEYKEIQTKNDKGFIDQWYEYYNNGNLKNVQGQIIINMQGGGSTSEGKTEIFEEYYENGNLKTKGQYELDRRVGIWKWYFENGEYNTEFNYKDGVE